MSSSRLDERKGVVRESGRAKVDKETEARKWERVVAWSEGASRGNLTSVATLLPSTTTPTLHLF